MTVDPPRETIRSLERRTRPLAVTQELEALGRLPRGLVRQRMRERGRGKGLSREALVSLARTYQLSGDTEVTQIALEALIARVSGVLHRKLQGWYVPASESEDINRHVLVGLITYWLNAGASEELWECNFTTPFELRTSSLIEGYFIKSVPTLSLQSLSEDGAETGTQRDIVDPNAQVPFEEFLRNVPVRAALQALAEHNPLWSGVLHDKYIACQTEEEIAARLGVTSRTIRNWVKEARSFLRAHVEKEGT